MDKNNWAYKEFEDCLHKVKYPPKVKTNEYLSLGLYPVVSQEKEYISGYNDDENKVFHHNNPVVIFGDHSRVIKYIDFDFIIGADGVKILDVKDFLNPKFFYYNIKWINVESLGYSRHYKLLKENKIPIPSLAEQERIVAELDLLSSIIDKKKAQLKELDQLAQSIFYDMFGDPITNEKGWEVKKLGDIGKIITGNTPSTRDERNYDSDDVCFFKPSDIAKDGISILEESEFHVSNFAYNNARKLPKGSVLVTCIGIVGKVGILEIDAMCNQQINAIIPNEDVASVYVAYSVLSERKIIESIAHAPVVPIINKGEFSQLCVPLPPLPLQQEFASKVEAIERQKSLIQQSIVETQTLFDSRMDYWFG